MSARRKEKPGVYEIGNGPDGVVWLAALDAQGQLLGVLPATDDESYRKHRRTLQRMLAEHERLNGPAEPREGKWRRGTGWFCSRCETRHPKSTKECPVCRDGKDGLYHDAYDDGYIEEDMTGEGWRDGGAA